MTILIHSMTYITINQSINQSIYSIQCSTSFWYTQKTIIYKEKYIAYMIYIYTHILMHGVADVYVYGSPRKKKNCYLF